MTVVISRIFGAVVFVSILMLREQPSGDKRVYEIGVSVSGSNFAISVEKGLTSIESIPKISLAVLALSASFAEVRVGQDVPFFRFPYKLVRS
jgi:hypothetical protein